MRLYLDIRNLTKAKIDKRALEKAALKTLGVLEVKDVVEVSLAIVGAARIKALNKKYRGIDRITDVLAFGRNLGKDRFVEPPDKVKRLGEVIICLSRAKKQAKSLGHSLKKELTLLFIHGILHLLGWQDETLKEKVRMKRMEERILEKIY